MSSLSKLLKAPLEKSRLAPQSLLVHWLLEEGGAKNRNKPEAEAAAAAQDTKTKKSAKTKKTKKKKGAPCAALNMPLKTRHGTRQRDAPSALLRLKAAAINHYLSCCTTLLILDP